MNKLKLFKITSLGESTNEWAPSKQSILEDLQRCGALDKDTIVEEITQKVDVPTSDVISAPFAKDSSANTAKIFTLPGGQKVKDDNGVLYGLEWIEFTKRDILDRLQCEDIEFPDGVTTIKILDWVELKPEGDDDASTTDVDV